MIHAQSISTPSSIFGKPVGWPYQPINTEIRLSVKVVNILANEIEGHVLLMRDSDQELEELKKVFNILFYMSSLFIYYSVDLIAIIIIVKWQLDTKMNKSQKLSKKDAGPFFAIYIFRGNYQ